MFGFGEDGLTRKNTHDTTSVGIAPKLAVRKTYSPILLKLHDFLTTPRIFMSQVLSIRTCLIFAVLCFCHGAVFAQNPSTKTTSAQANWQTRIWPAHQHRVSDAGSAIQQWLQNTDIATLDPEAVALLRELMAAKLTAINAKTLSGAWRVRSLQGGQYGLYLYPFFKANLRRDPDSFWFEKSTGSQRRSGRLFFDKPQQMVFLGTRSVNDDAKTRYRDKAATGPSENDSVGVLWPLGPNRLIMILDATTTDFEIYELLR
jgi:Domain of unknown function (DUF4893)